jgi:hypothetical protein
MGMFPYHITGSQQAKSTEVLVVPPMKNAKAPSPQALNRVNHDRSTCDRSHDVARVLRITVSNV